ncbi:MAG TPA: T9SS type A sorting domain-containing protein [Bacteroidales bacterium]|nr:T9SS type A sorting domain-containing protein [Bacteroidales bacterium]
MKRLAFILILTLSFFAGKVAGQCVDVGTAMADICQGGTSAALGGSIIGDATSAVWSDGAVGGSFSDNSGNTPEDATWSPPAGYSGTATLTLTASGGTCSPVSDSKNITVVADPSWTGYSLPTPTSFCLGGTVAFSVSVNDGLGGSITWIRSSSAGGAGTPVTTGDSPGVGTWYYRPQYTPTGAGCDLADGTETMVTVNPLPAAIDQLPSVCEDLFGGGTAAGVNLTLLENALTGGAADRSVAWYSNAVHTVTVPDPSDVTVTNGFIFYPEVTNTSTGCIDFATVTYTVIPKPLPENVLITGEMKEGATLSVGYDYNNVCSEEVPSQTEITWYRADDDAGLNPIWILIKPATDKSYVLTSADLGKHIQVCVKLSDGTIPMATPVCSEWSAAPVSSNDPPSAGIVIITGTPQVKQTLSGHYSYSDSEGDLQGISTYQWYSSENSNGIPDAVISGATALSYELKNTERDKFIALKVTPVALEGTLVGPEATSAWIGPVNNNPPVASSVYITGALLDVNSAITGHYTYTDAEGDIENGSTYQWYSSDDIGGPYSLIPGEIGIAHVIKITEQGKFFEFFVTPVTSTGTTTGTEVPSPGYGPANTKPSASDVTIIGDAGVGKTLEGSYVYYDADGDGQLYPGICRWLRDGVPITGATSITYLLTDEDLAKKIIFEVAPVSSTGYPNTGSPVQSPETPAVSANDVDFVGFDAVYCHDGAIDNISVSNVPDTATFLTFKLTTPAAIVDSLAPNEVVIDPGLMRPGNKNDTLSFSYINGGSTYTISRPFVIDSVGTDLKIVNIDPAYCYTNEPERHLITVEGTYPGGGAGLWTGSYMITYNSPTSAYLEVDKGKADSIYTISYQYISPSLICRSSVITSQVKINPLPDPFFTLDPTYNIDGEVDTLLAVQPGGRFVGKGISDSVLYPQIAGLGTHVIAYNITDENGCSDTLAQNTEIREAQGSFFNLPSLICYRDTTYNFAFTIYPTIATDFNMINSKNTIVYTPGDTIADYNVPAAGGGLDTVIFSYKWDGVDYSISKIVNVDFLGEIDFYKFPPDTLICNNSAPFELVAFPAGGTFTNPAVVGGYLYPSKDTVLTSSSLKYTYTNQKTGCFIEKEVPFIVSPAPKVSFVPVDVCIENSSDITHFINKTTPSDSIDLWHWEFSDLGETEQSDKIEPGYLFRTGGLHQVSLTATAKNGCSARKDSTINLGVKPVADFYWRNDCFYANDSISLFDSTSSITPIVSQSWNIVDEAPFSTEKNSKYPKISTGYLQVQYTVRTNYANCFADTIKEIFIRPTISLAPDEPYIQNFESGNGGWVKAAEDTVNNWSFGKPDRLVINTAASGESAWFTQLPYQKVESSSIVSPCFDFSIIERPMISIKLRALFGKNREGAVLQYKTVNNDSWQPVGTIDDGISWFNSILIQGWPGDDKIGWTTLDTADTKWKEASHTLDELKGRKDVKLRIAYGSNGTSEYNEGIAFDDIWIGERSRNVLLEHFTNTSDNDSKVATALVNTIATNKKEDVINIQYHTNFPGSDPFYDSNPGDVSARVLFYGLIRVPYTFIDGGTRIEYANLFDNDLVKIDSNDVARRSLINPGFDISLNTTISGGVLSIGGQITAMKDINPDNLTLYLAVTEKENSDTTGANGETIFYNVFRKFIPDAGGINLKKTWSDGESIALPDQTWLIEKIKSSSDIEVIAFIQDNITKNLCQATSDSIQNIVVGIEKLFQGKGNDFSLYPNPTGNKFTIALKEPLKNDADVRIYDIQGIVVASYKVESGVSEYTIENPGLKDGIYLVRISSGGLNLGFRKLIISGV